MISTTFSAGNRTSPITNDFIVSAWTKFTSRDQGARWCENETRAMISRIQGNHQKSWSHNRTSFFCAFWWPFLFFPTLFRKTRACFSHRYILSKLNFVVGYDSNAVVTMSKRSLGANILIATGTHQLIPFSVAWGGLKYFYSSLPPPPPPPRRRMLVHLRSLPHNLFAGFPYQFADIQLYCWLAGERHCESYR